MPRLWKVGEGKQRERQRRSVGSVMEVRTNSCGGLVAAATTRGHHLD